MAVNLGRRVVPSLLVADMRRTLEFYVEKLGFTPENVVMRAQALLRKRQRVG